MDIVRIATAGSVDDGKSTLIGRLLYETNSITADKLEAIERASKRRGVDYTDLSLLTDGLIAEREQGITIDVAHIYFSTHTRPF
jgi:sulfate adenylyltransferase subunit 1